MTTQYAYVKVTDMPPKRDEPDIPQLLSRAMAALSDIEQSDFARRLDTTQGTLSKWLAAKEMPSRKRWPLIAEVCGATTAEVGAAVGRTKTIRVPTRKQLELEVSRLRDRVSRLGGDPDAPEHPST